MVFQTGTFVDDRIENGMQIQLYNLGAFYVEVYYNNLTNEITRYRAFKSLAQLAPYIRLR